MGYNWKRTYSRITNRNVSDFEFFEESGQKIAPPHPDEMLVQWIWREQLLDEDNLICADGRSIRVLDPGHSVGGHGPDFRDAVLEIGGVRVCGDIEIHVQSKDWHAHKHSGDFAYNRVVLHVYLWAIGDKAVTDELYNGVRIPRLELGNSLEPDFDTLTQCFVSGDCSVAPDPVPGDEDCDVAGYDKDPVLTGIHTKPENYPCRRTVGTLDLGQRDEFLRAAGRQRMEERIARFENIAKTSSAEESLWCALLSGLACGRSRPLMFALAGRVPLTELADHTGKITGDQNLSDAVESVLVHVAGLVSGSLEDDDQEQKFDAAAQAWLKNMHEWWSKLSGWYSDRVMRPSKYWHSGMRPANFPERRLAGVARFLVRQNFRTGLLRSLAAELNAARLSNPQKLSEFRAVCNMLIRLPEVEGDGSFWGDHFTIGGKKQSAMLQLIGTNQASSLMFNVVLPHVILHARNSGYSDLEDHVWRILSHWPRLADNRTVRLMNTNLFGVSAPKPRYEVHQQAMMLLYQDCCSSHACEDCPLHE